LKGNLVSLSMLKYESNVIEKFLELENDTIIGIYVEELCINNGVLGNYKITQT
jgi:hypothetical protein